MVWLCLRERGGPQQWRCLPRPGPQPVFQEASSSRCRCICTGQGGVGPVHGNGPLSVLPPGSSPTLPFPPGLPSFQKPFPEGGLAQPSLCTPRWMKLEEAHHFLPKRKGCLSPNVTRMSHNNGIESVVFSFGTKLLGSCPPRIGSVRLSRSPGSCCFSKYQAWESHTGHGFPGPTHTGSPKMQISFGKPHPRIPTSSSSSLTQLDQY